MVRPKSYKLAFIVLCSLFFGLSVLWAILQLTGHTGDKVAHSFGGTYGLVALVGGIYGLSVARNWGFLKSYFGKAIILLSIGLLLQEFGQLAFTYLYIIAGIEVPYPSIADVGFFGAVPMYMAGAYYFMKGLGADTMIKKDLDKLIIGITVPLIILGLSYWMFLRGYETTGLGTLTILLDFGYPLGQAIYVSIALAILLLVGKKLGGAMKKPILALLLAFILQYAADFNFLYSSHQGTWVNGGYGDYLYMVAYFVMGISLVFLNRALAKAFTKLPQKR